MPHGIKHDGDSAEPPKGQKMPLSQVIFKGMADFKLNQNQVSNSLSLDDDDVEDVNN